MDDATRERFDRWDAYWAGEEVANIHDDLWAIWDAVGELMHSHQTKHFDRLTEKFAHLIGSPTAEGERFWREKFGRDL